MWRRPNARRALTSGRAGDVDGGGRDMQEDFFDQRRMEVIDKAREAKNRLMGQSKKTKKQPKSKIF
jgi:hypothetical protein